MLKFFNFIIWTFGGSSNNLCHIGFEKWIGFADVKSAPTYFYVQRNSSIFNATNIAIPFETAKLNIGGAFDLPSGIFTAPRTGTYFFSFIGFPEFPTSSSLFRMTVALVLNGNRIGVGEVEEANSISNQNDQVSLQSTLSLKPGDKIWIGIVGLSEGMYLFDGNNHYNHFSGWLLEEEFSLS